MNLVRVKKGRNTLLATNNLIPGATHFDERTIRKGETESRVWDPSRSKLGAALAKGMDCYVKEGMKVLYLGAGHGYTPSFVSDLVGPKGLVCALDFAPRVVRDLVFVCEQRSNMLPIMADAYKPETFKHLVPKHVDLVFQDVAQKNQVDIFARNCKRFLQKGGIGMLAVKSRSIDVTKKPKDVFKHVRKELEKQFTVIDYKELHPFEKDHAMFVVKL